MQNTYGGVYVVILWNSEDIQKVVHAPKFSFLMNLGGNVKKRLSCNFFLLSTVADTLLNMYF